MSRLNQLHVLLGGSRAGTLTRTSRGDIRFEYDPAWRADASAYPLSLSMPLGETAHTDRAVRPFVEGLLPDDDAWRREIARRHQVSARDPFALLTYVGEDCAGAVQFVRPERLDSVLETGEGEDLEWISDAEIGRELRDRVKGRIAWRSGVDPGYFSLAGAQPKIALVRREGRWARAHGRTPSTHILKPPSLRGLNGLEYNEHFCLRLANAIGLRAAESEVCLFDGQPAIVVSRFDREVVNGASLRIHQEDLCQALAVSPDRKYEAEGGPGVAELVKLIELESSSPARDLTSFLDALTFNWVIGGTDAHAKNFAFLIRPGPDITLAPLYDVISMLADITRPMARAKLKLAMRIGKEYALGHIDARRWRELAERVGLDLDPVVERVRWMTGEIMAAVGSVADQMRSDGIPHPVVDRLALRIRDHGESCLRRLED